MGSFKDVVGHKDVIRYIRSAIENQKVTHAYIMQGERGAGKKMLAGLFAETLLCEKQGTEPCNECHSCIQANSGSHPDLLWVSKRGQNSIGVDEIRDQLVNRIQIKPYQGRYKVFIVDQADLMTEQAQNALLKVIEEPPEYGIIMLLAENADVLLDTIRSRCVLLKLKGIKEEQIKEYLMKKCGQPDYKAEVCAAFAQGSLGKAIAFATSQHFNEIMEEMLSLLQNIKDMEIHEIMAFLKHMGEYKAKIYDCLDIMTIWYRDVLVYKATREDDKLVFKDQTSYMEEQVCKSSYEGIEKIIEGLDKAKQRLKANVNYDLAMELLLLTIKEN